MKRYVALLACAFALSACGNQSGSDQSDNDQAKASNGSEATASDQSDGQFADKNAKRSYALGMDIGNSLKDLPIDIDLDQLNQGVKDVVGDSEPKLSKKQLQAVMKSVVSDMEAAQKEEKEEKSKANLKDGKDFLSKNKSKDGVKTLDDGLQYKVVTEGEGDSPDANDSVTVDYTGKLIDGTVFDSSEKRGKPVTFPVNAVIPGWTEALQLMKPGGEYKLFIPPDLAYGERGAGSQIGPNETLIFDVKLISVDKNKGAGKADSDAQADDQTGDEAGDKTTAADASTADQGDDSSQ